MSKATPSLISLAYGLVSFAVLMAPPAWAADSDVSVGSATPIDATNSAKSAKSAYQPAGFVTQVKKGQWSLDGTKFITLKELDIVPDKALLVSKGPDDEIDIQLFDHSVVHRHGSEHRQNLVITVGEKPPGWQLWLQAINAIHENADGFVSTIAKASAARFEDGVAKLINEDLILTDLLKSLPLDNYKGTLTKINSVGETISGTRIGPFEVASNSVRQCRVGKIESGLYLFSLLSGDGVPTGEQSWIFVTDSHDFEKASRAWVQTRAAVARMSDASPNYWRQTFLHSYLVQYANQQ
jgi:hypothetical protein